MAHGYADIAMRRYRAGPLNILIFKKLAGLWWAGEVVNHIWIYGSKVAEGSSAFQRRSCYLSCKLQLVSWYGMMDSEISSVDRYYQNTSWYIINTVFALQIAFQFSDIVGNLSHFILIGYLLRLSLWAYLLCYNMWVLGTKLAITLYMRDVLSP